MKMAKIPSCHLSHIAGADRNRAAETAVWICEYPYRTMRMSGPSSEDCGDCPVFRAMRCGSVVSRTARPELVRPMIRPVAV